jgi:hypothetical protein
MIYRIDTANLHVKLNNTEPPQFKYNFCLNYKKLLAKLALAQ